MHSNIYLSIGDLLKSNAERNPDNVAIEAPGRAPLNYAHLYLHVREVVKNLSALGVESKDRVAIVLPNGPEMATAFVAIAASFSAAPLNPTYREEEFDVYLTDLKTKALVVQSGTDSPARKVAERHRIPVIELSFLSEEEAGIFQLVTGKQMISNGVDFGQPDDAALILHTSGTTSKPKIVPLTHANICNSAYNIMQVLHLKGGDRCLNVMPLFHIHGLIAALFSSIAAGASVVCTEGFYATKFFKWIEDFRPTWYTAVPTMHQAILQRVSQNQSVVENHSLRLIRSSSAPLPRTAIQEMEQVFHVTVIESYGMTEAAHQITSNPLPPRARKTGSVGVSAGPDVAIMDEEGNLLAAGVTGEIVLRGPNLTDGYDDNPAANQSAFRNGWFRTGDQGYLDPEGYLFITGRLKEMINRGGEKISPREIDEVLMDHPAVSQAVTFAVPDSRLGENVAAAVVIKDHVSATQLELREFAATRLADFKVPFSIVIVDEIPKGPTGKLQRTGLAEKLNLIAPEYSKSLLPFTPPRTAMEEMVAGVWAEVLCLDRISVHDNFFELGGDSILATKIFSRIWERMQVELSFINFFDKPTLADMAESIETAIRVSSSYRQQGIQEKSLQS